MMSRSPMGWGRHGGSLRYAMAATSGKCVAHLGSRRLPSLLKSTAMMEPTAARELSLLAKKNAGNFSIVMKDGQMDNGEDFYKKEVRLAGTWYESANPH